MIVSKKFILIFLLLLITTSNDKVVAEFKGKVG
jgi:hypothetical protein